MKKDGLIMRKLLCLLLVLALLPVSAAFAVLMILARNQMHVNIALSVLYVFFVFFLAVVIWYMVATKKAQKMFFNVK